MGSRETEAKGAKHMIFEWQYPEDPVEQGEVLTGKVFKLRNPNRYIGISTATEETHIPVTDAICDACNDEVKDEDPCILSHRRLYCWTCAKEWVLKYFTRALPGAVVRHREARLARQHRVGPELWRLDRRDIDRPEHRLPVQFPVVEQPAAAGVLLSTRRRLDAEHGPRGCLSADDKRIPVDQLRPPEFHRGRGQEHRAEHKPVAKQRRTTST
jgi:hypothetical protein